MSDDDDFAFVCDADTPEDALPEIASRWARWNIDALREQLDADPRLTPETRAHIVETFWPQGHAAALQAITSGWRRLQQERADAP